MSNEPKEHSSGFMAQDRTIDDCISRQAAIDFIDAGHLCNPNEPRWSDNEVVNFLKSRPSAQPERRFDEWCTDCKEYDHERHCCPRWNRVIRNTLQEAQRTGRWIEDSGNIACSECHIIWLHRRTAFCPNCGADMRGEQDE